MANATITDDRTGDPSGAAIVPDLVDRSDESARTGFATTADRRAAPAPIRAFYDEDDSRLADGEFGFTASTTGVKRDGLDLEMKGGTFDNFRRNPVVLWAHDYLGRNLPIGKVEKIRVLKNELRVRVVFDEADPFAAEVARKYRDGFLNAVSIGWEVVEFDANTRTVTEWDLLDISAVPVPGDPDALMERARSYQQDFLGNEERPGGTGETGPSTGAATDEELLLVSRSLDQLVEKISELQDHIEAAIPDVGDDADEDGPLAEAEVLEEIEEDENEPELEAAGGHDSDAATLAAILGAVSPEEEEDNE